MPEIRSLSREEKVVLAGCIGTIIVADGEINVQELDHLDRIKRRMGFSDYEACLAEFKEKLGDEPSLLGAAAAISNPVAQDLILQSVYEMSLQDGVMGEEQQLFFQKLNGLWKKDR